MENFTTTTDSAGSMGSLQASKDAKAEDTISETERLVIVVMLSCLSAVGIVGNALAIYVFTNLKQKMTSTIFILTLAGTDFLTCLITIPFTIAIESLEYRVSVDAICKVYHFLITTTVPFSCVIIVAIAVDRYMCICHPFHHWMTIRRARIIISVLVCVIFIIGGIACMHYTIYTQLTRHGNTTSMPQMPYLLMNVTSTQDPDLENSSFSTDPTLTEFQTFTEPHVGICNVNTHAINQRFFSVFRTAYSAIFLVSCIIVLVLYSIIYRSVIAQRRKKLRIKSTQCCLLWNAASIDASQEAVEMTQDFELSQVNGEERYPPRQGCGVTEYSETQNNGLIRKGSLSKARIEKMRVANIKTAFTLFIVTLVFIVAFLPSWLMALNFVSMNVIVFYMHYVYNVVNPLIYAFLNQNFKTELRRIVRCQNH
ncbi:unnamed protein product [Candidula unifasciata]|uniref:G-protein coupled receptors family 1 profile domain-containing protein n=1 Tax=Candidula unifasciata TaxID=100452 RepID=A0A8S3YPE9_9EUPU|nr:unnamed protein product [Candidula unifasciata]